MLISLALLLQKRTIPRATRPRFHLSNTNDIVTDKLKHQHVTKVIIVMSLLQLKLRQSFQFIA